jgi:hypothetical protein
MDKSPDRRRRDAQRRRRQEKRWAARSGPVQVRSCARRVAATMPALTVRRRVPADAMLTREQVLEVVAEVESLGPREALTLVVEYEQPALERAERLSEIQQVVDELRRRGRSPRVNLSRVDPRAEVHAVSLE